MAKNEKINDFYKDASLFLKGISSTINNGHLRNDGQLNKSAVIKNVLLLGVGIEKMLKGYLYNINPVLVLNNISYASVSKGIYGDLITHPDDNSDFLNFKQKDADVIALNESINRASHFSKCVFHHKIFLLTLKEVRDVIAHCELSIYRESDKLQELADMLERDFYPFVQAFMDENGMTQGDLLFFNNLNSQLATISSHKQKEVHSQYKLFVQAYAQHWKSIENNPTFNQDSCRQKTESELQKAYREELICPSCRKTCIEYTSPIMKKDWDTHTEIEIDRISERIQCFYCGLDATDRNIIEEIKNDQ